MPEHPDKQEHGARALIVQAADSLLPEAAIENLPALARVEIAAGLSGPLRNQIAVTGEHDPELVQLRDELVAQLGGSADAVGAMNVTDRVYLGRLVQGMVPPVVTAGCLWWYGHWRASCSGPSLDLAAAMIRLAQTWNDRPDQRTRLDDAIRELAQRAIDADSLDLTSAPV